MPSQVLGYVRLSADSGWVSVHGGISCPFHSDINRGLCNLPHGIFRHCMGILQSEVGYKEADQYWGVVRSQGYGVIQ